MKYRNIETAIFVERPNRFIAYVLQNGCRKRVHVKNTGRCRELLLEGAEVYLQKSENPSRSTEYDLIAVRKGARIINIDSQAPNKVVAEWLLQGGFFPQLKLLRPETVYGNSRFDFYAETEEEKIFIEVKGVTLEEQGIVRFPDAPSDRAVKHLEELIAAHRKGYRTCVVFVVQMQGARYFLPNRETHPEFADALKKAAKKGVELYAFDCSVTPDSLAIRNAVPVYLDEESVAAGSLVDFSKPLLDWYDASRRMLPWREHPTAYRVWVSEIMLQQTRVEAVKPYYDRFMKRLPDVNALAAADEETLLKLWEGLGYYNRVRNLQKAAGEIVSQFQGRIPDDYETLLGLPGIGSYTAGAISSIAYGKKRPAVDGNVLRVLSRLRRDGRLISDGKVKSQVERELLEVMPDDRPGDFNQAMMELGACVCVPNGAPHCELCPLASLCDAHRDGEEMEYPRKNTPRKRTIEEKTVLVLLDQTKTAIRKRPSKGLLAGMYEFPVMDGMHTADEVVGYLAQKGLKTLRIQEITRAKHIFTHKEWHMTGYLVRVDELESQVTGDVDWIFIQPEETGEKYPIPSAYAAYTKALQMKQGKGHFEAVAKDAE